MNTSISPALQDNTNKEIMVFLAKNFRRQLRIFPQIAIQAMTGFMNYYLFGRIIGDLISDAFGVSYAKLIFPGLIIISAANTGLLEGQYSIFLSRNDKSIQNSKSAPISTSSLMIGTIAGAITRMVACVAPVTAYYLLYIGDIALPFELGLLILGLALTSSMLGCLEGLTASNFGTLGVISNSFVTLSTVLSGGLFDIRFISDPFVKYLVLSNPLHYIVNTGRFYCLGPEIASNNCCIVYNPLVPAGVWVSAAVLMCAVWYLYENRKDLSV